MIKEFLTKVLTPTELLMKSYAEAPEISVIIDALYNLQLCGSWWVKAARIQVVAEEGVLLKSDDDLYKTLPKLSQETPTLISPKEKLEYVKACVDTLVDQAEQFLTENTGLMLPSVERCFTTGLSRVTEAGFCVNVAITHLKVIEEHANRS